jgi:hypothetical protein
MSAKAKKKKTAVRRTTIRSKLEALYQKHGYEKGKAAALKAGYNKHTVQRQMWLIHNKA